MAEVRRRYEKKRNVFSGDDDPLSCINIGNTNCSEVNDNKQKRNRRLLENNKERLMNNLPELSINALKITTWSTEDIIRESVVEITKEEDYGEGTVNDPAMGTVDKDTACHTCNESICTGHWGYIRLNYPVINPGMLSSLEKMLNSICHSCGKLLLSPKDIQELKLYMYQPVDKFKVLAEKSKVIKSCSNCNAQKYTYSSQQKSETNKDNENAIFQVVGKTKKLISPGAILEILKAFETDSETGGYSIEPSLIGFVLNDSKTGYYSKPSNWIIEVLPVMPLASRPPMEVNGRMGMDNITRVYNQIVRLNNQLRTVRDNSVFADSLKLTSKERYTYNQMKFSIVHLITNTDGKMQQPAKFQCLTTRLKGKDGIVRKQIMGKRTNQNARTVANPEPSLEFGEVLIPKSIAKVLTYPEKVNQINISYLQKLLEEGKIAKIIASGGRYEGKTFSVNKNFIENHRLQIGDVCHRQLQNGDYVLLNRQPTLQRQGMIGSKVVISDTEDVKVVGIHLSSTTGLNADFDGDEVNIHVPQTIGSIAETRTIANARQCIMHESNNRSVAGLVFDALVSATKLTADGNMVTETQFFDMLNAAYPNKPFDLQNHKRKVKQYNIPMYSGKSMFSVLLPREFYYRKGSVVIQDGILVNGQITKDHIGNSPGSIVQAMFHWSNDNELVADFITAASFMLVHYMTINPATIGLGDCFPRDPESHERMVNSEIVKMKMAVAALSSTKSTTKAESDRVESEIIARISEPSNKIAVKIRNELDRNNAFNISVFSGAKGSNFNIQQVMGLLGQQLFYGKRPLWNSPYFQEGDKSPEARGFIGSSFLKGLDPEEFLFHVAASRIGILDTVTKVSSSGEVQRNIMRFLESIVVQDNGTVTSADGSIVQFLYGNDGYNSAHLIRQQTSIGKLTSFIDMNNTVLELNAMYGYA